MKPSIDVIIAGMKQTGERHSILLYGLKEATQKEITKALMDAFPDASNCNSVLRLFYEKSEYDDNRRPYCFTFYKGHINEFRYIGYDAKEPLTSKEGKSCIQSYINLKDREFIMWEPKDAPELYSDIWS